MSLALRAVQSLALVLLALGLGVVSLVWNLVALALYPLMRHDAGLALGRRTISRVYRGFWRLCAGFGLLEMDATALDVLRDEAGLIVVSNHPCVLDALMLVARLPRAACLMKASLMHNPFLGPGAKLARYLPNDTAIGTIRACVKDLRRGGQLVMFPEGTRTTRFPVNPFQPGVTAIAKHAKVPIQVVFIDTDSPYLGKGWPIWRLPSFPMRISVRMGPRLEPGRDADAQLVELERVIAEGTRTNVVENRGRAHRA
jgi:1-acyl-sn-glycerol-3-phosphate acyltransferase